MAGWTPLPSIKHGRVISPFIPLEKLKSMRLSDNFCNIYPGDEVYIVEENGSEWGRGYVISQALPSDFSSAVINLNKLPDQKVRIAIVPLSHIRIIDDIPIGNDVTDTQLSVANDNSYVVPSILDSEISSDTAVQGYDALVKIHKKPPLPKVESSDDLLLELKAATAFLTSHIYAMYSLGEFHLFGKLVALYHELEDVRITFAKNLGTARELARLRMHASTLLTKIPKFLSGTEKMTQYEEEEKFRLASSDVSGYRAILARDPASGELLNAASKDSSTTPIDIAMNQLLYALSGSYPLNELEATLEPKSHGLLDRIGTSSILVNFEAVSGSSKNVPRGFKGMTAYLYLRNKKKPLTEAFAIHVNSKEEFKLENFSAALFKHVSATEVDNNGKVYLVALLIEEVDISHAGKDLQVMKKGIAAGVTDISRIISKHTGALATGQSHEFNIKLYGSFITPQDSSKPASMSLNNGWGELVDRIIQGSTEGVAINPRAESLTLSVKEIKSEVLSTEKFLDSQKLALTPIRTLSFDPLSKSNERIHLCLKKVDVLDSNSAARNSYISLVIKLTNLSQTITQGANQEKSNTWNCVSIIPGEIIGETLHIEGLDKFITAGEEYVKFYMYSNGDLKAEGKLLTKKDATVSDTDAKVVSVPLNTPTGSQFGSLTLSTEYVGTIFNRDKSIDIILQWKDATLELTNRTDLLHALTELSRKGFQPLLRHFRGLLSSLIEIYEQVTRASPSSIEPLIFNAIVHILDVVVGKNYQYLYLFDEFCNTHKNSTTAGSSILLHAPEILSQATSEWTQLGRQFCRASPYVLKLAIVCNKDTLSNHLTKGITVFNSELLRFLALAESRFLAEQLVILENLNYYFVAMSSVNSEAEIWMLASSLLNQLGTRGLGMKDEADNMIYKSSKLTDVGTDKSSLRAKTDASHALMAKKKKEEHKLIIAKLSLIRKILHSNLMHSTTRNLILSSSISWTLEVLLGPYDIDAARLATGNLAKCLEFIYRSVVLPKDEENWHLVRSVTRLLPVLSKVFIKYNKYCKLQGAFKSSRTFTNLFQSNYPFVEETMDSIITKEVFVELLIELSSTICFVIKFSKHCMDLRAGFDAIQYTQQDKDFMVSGHYTTKLSESGVVSLIQLSKIMFDAHFFPSDKWLSLHALLVEGSFSILEILRFNMMEQFIPPSELSENFNTSLWGNYLRSILKMITSKPAATYQLSQIPGNGCANIIGDLRDRGADLMEEVWDALGWEAVDEDIARFQLKRFTGYQSEFLSSDYSILKDLMLFYLQRHERCQVVGVKIFWTIIASECILNEEGLTELAKESITGLYDLYHSDGYKPVVQEVNTFVKLLKMTIRIAPQDVAYKQITSFIENLTDFLYILNDLRNVPYSDEFDDDRTFHKLNILGFLLNVNQPDLLYQFIDDMYQSSLEKGNYVQAALSLELLANTYNWSLHTLLPPSSRPYFPQQTPFKRKESLYRMIAHNYTKGNSLEQAVEIYSELRDAYDNVSLDLKGLAYVNAKLSKLYTDLQNPDRIMPSYFKVCYIGSGFPVTLRGKKFIHQGLPFEQLSSIQDRLSRLHPGSRILMKESDMAPYEKYTPIGKFLYINSVEPGKGFSAQNSLVSYSSRLYVQNKELKNFVSFKRLPNATGIHDLWSEEHIYETYEAFPALMNRSEIKEVHVNKLSPIENAFRAIVTKNHDLANIESMIDTASRDKEDSGKYFGDLSRQVSGTVDSPVNGGIGQYRIFFSEAYDKLEYKVDVLKLKSAFNDLAIILNRCLEWHGRLSPAKLQESHAQLLKLFKQNFAPEIAELGLIIRDTIAIQEDTGSTANGYNSYHSSDDESADASRVKTNVSLHSSGSSSDLVSTVSKLSTNTTTNGASTNSSVNVNSSSVSVKSGSSKRSGTRRLMNWRQSRFG